MTTPPSGPATTQSFDANGNLTLQNTGGALTTMSWDGENRLTSVANNTGTEAYSYSTGGLRQKKVTPSGTVNLVWDNQNLLQERDASLVKLAQYTDFPGFWGGLASQRRSGVSGFYGFDSQSSSRVLVSVGGLVTDSYSYKAFGEELAAGSGTANNFRYVGAYGYYRDVVSRYYVRARHLDVTAGRWVSRDPIGLNAGDMNNYRYVHNRILYFVDPSGHEGITLLKPPIEFPPISEFPPVIDDPKPPIWTPSTGELCLGVISFVCIADACYELCTYRPGIPTGPIGAIATDPIIRTCYPEPDPDDPGELPDLPDDPGRRCSADQNVIGEIASGGQRSLGL